MNVLQRVSTSVFLIALLLIAAFPVITDSDSASAQRARRPITLQPGGNWVGWFDREASARVLFEAFPALESIHAWGPADSSESGEPGWLVAYRNSAIPERRPLHTLEPGMGLFFFIGGDGPVDIAVARTPATGMVELYAGANLVAWLGSDATEIADAMRGVGQALESAHIWDSTRGGWCSYRPALGRLNPSCTVQPGAAVWVYVDRDINWLQPTDVSPQVVFAGAVSPDVRTKVDRDLDAAMDFFAEEWGVQADHSRTTLFVASDGNALAEVIPNDYSCEDVRKTWSDEKSAAWHCPASEGTSFLVFRHSRWDKKRGQTARRWGRYDLVHEYTHAVQHQLSGEIDGHPTWLVEGAAFWTEGLLYVDDQRRDRDWLRRDNEVRLRGLRPDYPSYNHRAPRLEYLAVSSASVEHGEGPYRPWEYELGSIAVERLAGSALGGRHVNQDSIIEYWRQSLDRCEDGYDETTDTTTICGLGDDEPDAFSRAFGRTIDRFYEEFKFWRAGFNDGGRELPDDAMSDGPLPDDEMSGGPFAGGFQYPR